jgi:hypothetical protein
MKTARLLGNSAAEVQSKKADLNKLSGLLQPGQIVHTIDGSAYRVASKVASDGGFSFRLADLNGKPVQTPANFKPISAALARTAAWMRFVFAYNADFDKYVKAYIEEAGLPVDNDMNWAKWFQYTYPRKLSGLTQDPEMVDEAIHQVLITSLAHRKDLTKFDAKRLPAGAQNQSPEKQVTTYLEWLFKKRVSEAYEFIKEKLMPQGESIDESWSEGEGYGAGSAPGKQDVGDNRSILDTEEYATPADTSGDEQKDLAGLRDQFAAYLNEDESPREIEKLLVLYDYFSQNVGHKLKISQYEQYWKEKTGLGFDSLKPVYAKFYRYIGDFMVAAGLVDASKAKARGQAVGVKSSLNSLTTAGAEWDPETKTYSDPDKCPRCEGTGVVAAPAAAADTTWQGAGKCPACNGTGKIKHAAEEIPGAGEYQGDNAEVLASGPTSDTEVIPQAAEAGPSNDEKNLNQHEENGVPVLDGTRLPNERPNVNAVKETLEAQQEMEVGKPIDEKAEELAAAPAGESKSIQVPSGANITININAKTAADWIAMAQQAIENDDEIIYDVAAEVGQIVDNVKHMRWFVEAVAQQLAEDNGREDFRSASKSAANGNCECGHHKTYHDGKNKMCHGGTKESPCNCDGRFKKAKTADDQTYYFVSTMNSQASTPGLEQGMRLVFGYSSAKPSGTGAQKLLWWKEMPEAQYKQLVERVKRSGGSNAQMAERLFVEVKNSGGVVDAEGATTDEILQYFKTCPECDHALPHPPEGCEVERGDHPGGEGDNGPYGAYAMGPCGCKWNGGYSPKTGAAGAAPGLAPKSFVPRRPTEGEMQHEQMRFNQAYGKGDVETYLQRRLNSISNPQKLFAFALMCENENFHTFNEQVFEKLKSLGWNGDFPKDASGPDDTGHMLHNPSAGDGNTGPNAPIVVDEKTAAPVPPQQQAPVKQAPQGPQQKQYGTPPKEQMMPDPNNPNNQQQPNNSGYGQPQQPRQTVPPELPNAMMRMQLNSSKKAWLGGDDVDPTDAQLNDEGLYVVVRSGGAVGEKPWQSEPMSKAEAQGKARRFNQRLSPGEKKYYRIRYSVRKAAGYEGPDDANCPGCGDPLNNAVGPYCGGKFCPKTTDPSDLHESVNQSCPSCGQPLQQDMMHVLRCYNENCDKNGLTADVPQPIDKKDFAERGTRGQSHYGPDPGRGSFHRNGPERGSFHRGGTATEPKVGANMATNKLAALREKLAARSEERKAIKAAAVAKKADELSANEAMQEFADEIIGQDVKWVSGREKGMIFTPRSFEPGSDPHFRGSYQRHPEFGNIPDDMHQAWSLIEDLANGTAVATDSHMRDAAERILEELDESMEEDFESYPDDPMTDEEFAEAAW